MTTSAALFDTVEEAGAEYPSIRWVSGSEYVFPRDDDLDLGESHAHLIAHGSLIQLRSDDEVIRRLAARYNLIAPRASGGGVVDGDDEYPLS